MNQFPPILGIPLGPFRLFQLFATGVSTTLSVLVAKFAAGVVDNGGAP
jgi:hypothetical protein